MLTLALVLAAAAIQPPAQTPPELLTVAERTAYQRTASHAETVALLDALGAASPLARRVSMGTTAEGRDIPMLVMSDPPVSSGAEARELSLMRGRPVVLAIGNIHAGEVDGKEALPMVARELLLGARAGLLSKAIIVIAPIYNADGNERVGPGHRAGQNGPELVGIRENSRGRDLNRDFMKLEEAETRALARVFNEFDPHVFIDCHITNGSYHRYVITYDGPRTPGGDAELVAFARTRMLPEIDDAFEKSTGDHAFWYGSFEGEFGGPDRGHTRWETYPAEPRFGTTYVGLRNRLSVLVESYTYEPYEHRVTATREFVLSTLDWVAANHAAVLAATREADDRAVLRGQLTNDDDRVAIRTRAAARSEKSMILGYVEETIDGRSRSTGVPTEYPVDVMDAFEATESVSRPLMYAIPADPALDGVIATLRMHGLRMETLDREFTAKIEEYTVTGVAPASREFQGHVLVNCEVSGTAERRTLTKGTVLVTTAQPLGHLAVALLEPRAEDSLAVWNAFDAWMKPGAKYPVLRVVEKTGGP
ncbi:MAG: M14 family metallopeptidase [Phycisphaerales bacterium]